MARDNATKEPTSITAGDTVVFEVSPAEFPPSEGWTGSYSIVLATSQIAATVTDDDQATYTVTFGASQLATVVQETEARLVGRVTGSGDYAGKVYTIYDARVTILPNLTAATLTLSRTQAEKELDLVNAAIEKALASDIESYGIGGRSVTKRKLAELYRTRALLEARIRAERGLPFRKRLVAFG